MKPKSADIFLYSLVCIELMLIGFLLFYEFESKSQEKLLRYVTIGIGLPLFFFYFEEILQFLDPRNKKDKND